MAIYHLSAKLIRRSDGRSATAAAAYRSASLIHDARQNLVHDYTAKSAVDHCAIITPESAPAWAADRESLWNAAEAAEKRKDAQVAREVEVALPRELTAAQAITLAEQFARDQFVSRGMVADVCIHHLYGDTPHAHILLTMREIVPDGFSPKKNRTWNDKALLETWRVAWANHCNQALAEAGHDCRVDHRSLTAQGTDRPAQAKAGPKPDRATRQHNRQCQDVAQAQAALAAEQEQQELAGIIREAVEQNRSHLLMRSAKRQVKRAREQLASCTDAKPAADLAAERARFDAMHTADRLLRRARSVLQLARRVPAMLRELKNNLTMESKNVQGWLQRELAERNRHLARQQRNEREPPIRQREAEVWPASGLEM